MRSFTVRVNVVDHVWHGSSMRVVSEKKADYEITVDKSQLAKMGVEPYAVALHELGHVFGHEFHMPRHMQFLSGQQYDLENYEMHIMARENEAWDIATVTAQMQRCRRIALRSYDEMLASQRLYRDLTAGLWDKPKPEAKIVEAETGQEIDWSSVKFQYPLEDKR